MLTDKDIDALIKILKNWMFSANNYENEDIIDKLEAMRPSEIARLWLNDTQGNLKRKSVMDIGTKEEYASLAESFLTLIVGTSIIAGGCVIGVMVFGILIWVVTQ